MVSVRPFRFTVDRSILRVCEFLKWLLKLEIDTLQMADIYTCENTSDRYQFIFVHIIYINYSFL